MIIVNTDSETLLTSMEVVFGRNTVGISYHGNQLRLSQLSAPVADEDRENAEVVSALSTEETDEVVLIFENIFSVGLLIKALVAIESDMLNEKFYGELHKSLEEQIALDAAEGHEDDSDECCDCGTDHELYDENNDRS